MAKMARFMGGSVSWWQQTSHCAAPSHVIVKQLSHANANATTAALLTLWLSYYCFRHPHKSGVLNLASKPLSEKLQRVGLCKWAILWCHSAVEMHRQISTNSRFIWDWLSGFIPHLKFCEILLWWFWCSLTWCAYVSALTRRLCSKSSCSFMSLYSCVAIIDTVHKKRR